MFITEVHRWWNAYKSTKLYLFTPRSLARCRFSFFPHLAIFAIWTSCGRPDDTVQQAAKGLMSTFKGSWIPPNQPWNKQLVQLVSFSPWIWPDFSIFHQPRFPWNSRGFPETSATFWGAQVMWGRYRWMKHISWNKHAQRIDQHEQRKNWRTTSPKTSKLVVFFDAKKTSIYIYIYQSDLNTLWRDICFTPERPSKNRCLGVETPILTRYLEDKGNIQLI